jgi:hypothetical protein
MVDSNEQRELIRQTVKETLLSLGIEVDDPIKVQRDFQHLREWRETTEALKSKGLMTLFGVVLAGILGFIWLGFKGSLGVK